MFTGQSAPEVIRAVLADAGLSGPDVELRLSASHPVESHVCQYKESDLDFVSRWMEREGMYYFFEQGDEAEKLVIVDHLSAHDELSPEPVRYRPTDGRDVSARACFDTLAVRHRVLPSKVKLRDYDYDKPTLDVSGEALVARGGALAEVVEHGGRFFTPADGERLARIRAEETARDADRARGGGDGLRSAARLHLRPRGSPAGFDEPRLPVHRALPPRQRARDEPRAQGPHRRPRHRDVPRFGHRHRVGRPVPRAAGAPRPGVAGTESALVDGPIESDYAQIDAEGRYHVKLAVDEGALKDGKASTAIRMMQPHAGNPEGFHFPLRKGTEVILGFLGGDPDRPVIAGEAPNAANPSPVTSANHTRNIVNTGSDNHIEIEDRAGAQWIDLRSPPEATRLHLGQPHDDDSHFVTVHTGGDCLFDIGFQPGHPRRRRAHGDGPGRRDGDLRHLADLERDGPAVDHRLRRGARDVLGRPRDHDQRSRDGALRGQAGDDGDRRAHRDLRRRADHNRLGGVTETYGSSHHWKQQGASSHQYLGTLSSTATGAVTQLYDGAVTLTWGPVTSTYGTTSWSIPGSANVTTSSFVKHIGHSSFIMSTLDWLKSSSVELTGVSVAVVGALGSLRGVSQESVGLSVEATGGSHSMGGARSYTCAVEVEVDGLDTLAAGLQLLL